MLAKLKSLHSLFFVLILALTFSVVSVAAGLEDPYGDAQWLKELAEFIFSPKGAGLALAVTITQLLMAGFRTSLANFAGVWRLAIVYVLNAVFVFLSSLATGMSFGEVLVSAPALAALSNAVHQVILQIGKAKAEVKG